MKISERVLEVLKREARAMTAREIAEQLGDVSSRSVAVACWCDLHKEVYREGNSKPSYWRAKPTHWCVS